MSHGDHVEEHAVGFEAIATTDSCIAVIRHNALPIYNLQFHPEVTHTEEGVKFIQNFIDICNISEK